LIDQWLSPGRFEKLIHALQTGRILPPVPVPRGRDRTVRSRWQEPEVGRFFEVTDQETRSQQSAGSWAAAGLQTGQVRPEEFLKDHRALPEPGVCPGKTRPLAGNSLRAGVLPCQSNPLLTSRPGKSGALAVPFVSNGNFVPKRRRETSRRVVCWEECRVGRSNKRGFSSFGPVFNNLAD
jgi:hypothetical protein